MATVLLCPLWHVSEVLRSCMSARARCSSLRSVLCALQEVLISPDLGSDVCTQLAAVVFEKLGNAKDVLSSSPLKDPSVDPAVDPETYARDVVKVRPCVPFQGMSLVCQMQVYLLEAQLDSPDRVR